MLYHDDNFLCCALTPSPILRLSNLPMRIETGCYERPRLEEEDRLCLTCGNEMVENEYHVLFVCSEYEELQQAWMSRLTIPDNFVQLSQQKFKLVLNEAANVKLTAQFLVDLYNLRGKIHSK